MLLTIVIFVLVLSVLVFAHELGHFFTARRLGVKAEEFGFGFPPRALGFYRNKFKKWRLVFGSKTYESLEKSADENINPNPKSTIYSLNWLPLGGFVKIKGQDGDDKHDKDSFASQKIWKRLVILAAGVIMNVFLAWGLFSIGYMIGLPQVTETASKNAIISEPSVIIASVIPDSPAATAGLQPGDIIKQVGGQIITSESALQEIIGASDGQTVSLAVNRNGEDIDVLAEPASKDGGRATIGVAIFASGTVRYPFFSAIFEGAKTTGLMLKEITVAFGSLFSNLFQGKPVADQFAGPIGIANVTGEAARLGFIYLLQFTALLSLNLAIINILPFPALDGGRILFLLVEKLKGRPVKQELEGAIHNIGFLLLIALIIFVTYKDIIRLF